MRDQGETLSAGILRWSVTGGIRQAALEGMNRFGREASDGLARGADPGTVLGGPVQGFGLHRDLVHGVRFFARAIGHPIGGVMADLGSGRGVGACIVSTFPEVTRVYAIEYSSDFVVRVMPTVFRRYGADQAKIQRVIGDYNRLDLPDGSLGGILALASYHHAENLDAVVRESARALRGGGVLLAIERAHPDSVTQAELQAMLEKPYGTRWKRKRGIPDHVLFTRRDWGEHEYRVGEWLAAFRRAGFDAVSLRPWGRELLRPVLRSRGVFRTSLLLAAGGFRAGLRRLRYCYPGSKRTLFVCVRDGKRRP